MNKRSVTENDFFRSNCIFNAIRTFALMLLFWGALAAPSLSRAAELKPDTLAHWDAYGWLHALCWQPDELIVCCCKACCTSRRRAVEDKLQMAVYTPAGAPPCHLPEAVPKVPRQAPAGVLLQGLPVGTAIRHSCWHPSELQLAHGCV